MPQNASSQNDDLDLLHAWLARFVEAQRANLSEHEDAVRQVQRLIALLDGSAEPQDARDDLRLLIAKGVLTWRLLAIDKTDEPVAGDAVQSLAFAALWPVVALEKFPEPWFGALRQLTSHEVAVLVSNLRAVFKYSQRERLAMQFRESLGKPEYKAGVLNLLEDLRNPNGGWPVLWQVRDVRDGKPSSEKTAEPHDLTSLLKVLGWVGTAAAAGIVGERADALLQHVIDYLAGGQPASPTEAVHAGTGPKSPTNQNRWVIEHPFHLALMRVPAGEFLMGSDPRKDKVADESEQPQHRVYVSEFYIGRYPVTVAQFAAFAKATRYRTDAENRNSDWTWFQPRGKGSDVKNKGDHPVTNVSWNDATAFRDWLSRQTGHVFRLPTEAEWEKAARSADGRIYPWGDQPLDDRLCNFNNNVGDTTPVGHYSPQGDSPYGCADMAGNVWEWCQDWWDEKEYQRRVQPGRVVRDPQGPSSGTYRALRGGAFGSSRDLARCALRNPNNPDLVFFNVGFRVVVRAHLS